MLDLPLGTHTLSAVSHPLRLVTHFRFVRDHQQARKESRSRNRLHARRSRRALASPFVSAETRHFPGGQLDAAKRGCGSRAPTWWPRRLHCLSGRNPGRPGGTGSASNRSPADSGSRWALAWSASAGRTPSATRRHPLGTNRLHSAIRDVRGSSCASTSRARSFYLDLPLCAATCSLAASAAWCRACTSWPCARCA
jgi:hypothetical protein